MEQNNDEQQQVSEDGEKKYLHGLTKRYGRTPEYQFTGDKCVPGCIHFSHYETKHHRDCPFYKESLSKKYDEIESELSKLKEENESMKKVLKRIKTLSDNNYNDGSGKMVRINIMVSTVLK